jgi:hypothetical protein
MAYVDVSMAADVDGSFAVPVVNFGGNNSPTAVQMAHGQDFMAMAVEAVPAAAVPWQQQVQQQMQQQQQQPPAQDTMQCEAADQDFYPRAYRSYRNF